VPKKGKKAPKVTQERGSHSTATSVANGHVCCVQSICQLDNSWIVRLEEMVLKVSLRTKPRLQNPSRLAEKAVGS
jgi:hypothetical protein